jgi:hypothetical protein
VSLSHELSAVPHLHDRWVAVDLRGRRSRSEDRRTPLALALRSGAVVVDADRQLDELCARLHAARRTSLTIVFNAAPRSC